MSTNFYHHYNRCEHCGREDVRHIGKSMTMFAGYRPDPDFPEDPFEGPQILSWEDWKRVLRAGGEIWDEYDRQWDVEKFIADVEGTSPNDRRRQYEWIVTYRPRDAPETEWLDPDGFSFTDREFS